MTDLSEWLTPENLDCAAGYLRACENSSMLADVRGIFPAEVLKQSVKLLSPLERLRIKQWVLMLNDNLLVRGVYCDGSGTQHKPGGWGVAIEFDNGIWLEFGGYYPANTTNQQMELLAIGACQWLNTMKIDYPITIYSDSEYTIKGIKYWVKGWTQNGWLTKDGRSVSNRQFWEKLSELNHQNFRFEHVPGHSGIEGNERADKLAGMARKSQQNIGECPFNRHELMPILEEAIAV